MKKDYKLEIKNILKSNLNNQEKKLRISKYHDSDIADYFETLDKDERLKFYKILGKEYVSRIFTYFDDVSLYIDELSKEQAADIIELLDSDDAKDVLDELEEESRKEIINLMENESKEDLALIDNYEDDEIGSLMTNNYIDINSNDSVKSAMKKLISLAVDFDNISIIYVCDDNQKYYGCIELRDLILARENDDLNKIIKTSYPVFYAKELISNCLDRLQEYSLDSYPILASDNTLIGTITQDDITEVVNTELGDDYAKLGGLTEEEELEDSVFISVKKRIPWLIILLLLGLVESTVLSNFEAIITFLPALVFFQSTILDMSGNSSTQSLAVTIRLISSDNFDAKVGAKNIFKELRIGIINAICISLISFAFVFAYVYLLKNNYNLDTLGVVKTSFTVSIALLVGMSLSCLIGSSIPMFFKKIKVDPAVASGPFITTINDIISLLIYYGLSTLLFLVF